ncbi:MAG: recombinase-like helix-turn-helix domain-containing protein [Acetobacter sp.]|uniref:recombinase-like helix-turn-helix domain-containing protein n=1 Tax=Acetobacter sp. TaxID=440 RepID=UPI0039E75EF2
MKKPFVPYNETFQSRLREPDPYENMIGDALEAAFARGATTLADILPVLAERDIAAPDGSSWTEAKLAAELARLAD